MGDFNTKVGGKECRHKVSGKHSLHEYSKENGLFMVQFAIRNNFYIKSTTFPHKTIHMGTWKIPGFTEVNQTDYVLVSAKHASSIIDIRNSREANCDSDHYLVKAEVRERIIRSWKHRAGCGRRKWNSELITSPEGKMRYQASLEKNLEGAKIIESGFLDMNKMWNDVKEKIMAAGEKVMGTTTIQKRNVEWFDEECRGKIAKKNKVRRRMLQKETRGSYEKYKELQIEVKKVCKKKKKEHLQKQLEEIEQLNRQDERRKFYKAMDNIRKGYHPRQEACRDKDGKVLFDKEEIMNRWAEHFREVLNKVYPSCNDQGKPDPALNIEESDKGENSEIPTYGEIEASIKKLKNGRAPSEDNIIPEMIKYGGKQLVKNLHELICVI